MEIFRLDEIDQSAPVLAGTPSKGLYPRKQTLSKLRWVAIFTANSGHWRIRLNNHDESRLRFSRTRYLDPQVFEHHFACGGPKKIFSHPGI
jgi:hypothetical protein